MRVARCPAPMRVNLFARTIADAGFFLIEALVASGLLAIALAALAHLFVIATRANVDARDVTYATVLAAQKIEELRAAAFPESSTVESTDYLDARGNILGGGDGFRTATYVRRWRIEPLAADHLNAVVITVTVSRRQAGSGAARLTTVRARSGLAALGGGGP